MVEFIRSYRDLRVWCRAMDLIDEVTVLSRSLERSDRFVYETQVRRAAVSIASSIAEGHERLHTREFRQYVYVGRGSLGEVETQVMSIGRNTRGHAEQVRRCLEIAGETGRMLTRLGESLTRKRPRHPGPGHF
jgi:four helix bundle protein